VAAGLGALHHERVHVRGGARLVRARHGHPRLRAGAAHARDHALVRQAEGEGHDRHRRALEQLELRVPVVVVEARQADGQPFGLEPGDVAREHVARRRGAGHEQVHAEGTARQAPRALDPLPERVR
jgi:hypothetical protein